MPRRELSIPDAAETGEHADDSVELLRVWWVGDRPHFVMTPALNDPRDVGRMLGEAMMHFSQVYASKGLGEPKDLVGQMLAGFEDIGAMQINTVMTKPTGSGKA